MQCYFRFKLNLIPANTTGIKNTVLVIQFQSVNYTLLLRYAKILSKTSCFGIGAQDESSG